jgi:hypothetical protein
VTHWAGDHVRRVGYRVTRAAACRTCSASRTTHGPPPKPSPATLEPGMLERLSQMSADRQRAIISDQCTSLSVVIGEGALRQVIGGPA